MSIELTLIPLAIATGVIVRRAMDKRRQNEHYMQTSMKDRDLLRKVLAENGCEVEVDKSILTTEIDGLPAVFSKDDQGIYSVVINGELKTGDALAKVKKIEEKYGRALQEQEYQKLMAGARQNGYELQTNEMLPGKVIHLVFNLPQATGNSGQMDVRAEPNGSVDVRIEGLKGPKCTEYAAVLEKMIDARASKYDFTDEYYQSDESESEKRSIIQLEDE
ncbi:MAG: DUF2997 domain-containing protein [Candidatus Geothermincolia bacterium]